MPITCHFTTIDSSAPNTGLGNMLFQIATVLALARENNDDAVFPYLEDYYTKYGTKYVNTIFRNLSMNKFKIKRKYSYDWNYEPIEYKTHMQINGYFCSYKYFDNYEKYIKKVFEPDVTTLNYINSKYSDILNKSTISVHVRRGDFVKLGNYFVQTSLDYYLLAINKLEKLIGTNNTYLIFSDDIEWCKKNFTMEHVLFIHEDDYIDMYIMSLCKHNIITNSTFSWWAAYLNDNPNKIVMCPKIWFNKENDWGKSKNEEQLICPKWVAL